MVALSIIGKGSKSCPPGIRGEWLRRRKEKPNCYCAYVFFSYKNIRLKVKCAQQWVAADLAFGLMVMMAFASMTNYV
jgi:hypothetical protein